jgi:hypothetical protein
VTRMSAVATIVLLALLVPLDGERVVLQGSTQSTLDAAWSRFHRFDDEAARQAFAEAQRLSDGSLMSVAGGALTYLPHPYQEGSYGAGRDILLGLGVSREARRLRATAARDRLWLRLLESAFGGDAPIPAWSDMIQTAEALGVTDPADPRAALLLTARLLLSSPVSGNGTTQAGPLLRVTAGLEELVAAAAADVEARHYLVRLYLRRGEALQARRHARYLLGQAVAPRLVNSALLALSAAGEWGSASDGMGIQGRLLPGAESPRILWQAYLLLQEGRMGEAEALLRPLWTIPTDAALPARMNQARARSLWVIESRRWVDARLGASVAGMDPDVVAGELLAAGMAGVRVGNQQLAMDALARMALLVGDGDAALPVVTAARPAPAPSRPGVNRPGVASLPTSRPMRPGAVGTVAVSDDPASIRLGIQRRRAAVMAQQLEAYTIFAEGRRDEAIVLARQAASVAEDLPSDSMWPMPVKPAHELVGDLLLEARRPVEAMAAYQDSLNRWPQRPLSLLGLYRAATQARHTERAAAARAELARVWGRGDRRWSEIAEVVGAPHDRDDSDDR